jgi:hypothetical protein
VGPVEGVEGKGLVVNEQQFDVNQYAAKSGHVGDSPSDTGLYKYLMKAAQAESQIDTIAQQLLKDLTAFRGQTNAQGFKVIDMLTRYARILEREARKPARDRNTEWRDQFNAVREAGVPRETLARIHKLVMLSPGDPLHDYGMPWSHQNIVRDFGAYVSLNNGDVYKKANPRFGFAGAAMELIGDVAQRQDEFPAENPISFHAALLDLGAGEPGATERLKEVFKYDKLPRNAETNQEDVMSLASPKALQTWMDTTSPYEQQISQIPIITSVNERLRLVANDLLRQAYIADLDFIALPDAETILTAPDIGFSSQGTREIYDTHLPNTFARLLGADAADFPRVQTTVNGAGLDNDAHIKIIPLTKEVKDMIRVQLTPGGMDLDVTASAGPRRAPDEPTFDGTAAFTGKPNPLYAVPFAAMAGEAARRAMSKEEEPPQEN